MKYRYYIVYEYQIKKATWEIPNTLAGTGFVILTRNRPMNTGEEIAAAVECVKTTGELPTMGIVQSVLFTWWTLLENE